MRLPIASPLVSRDGAANKDARLTNMLKESDGGRELAVTRPGLALIAAGSGVGGGLVAFNGELISVYGTTLGISDPVSLTAWTGGTTYGATIQITSVAYLSGVYVAVGTNTATTHGVIYSSTDGLLWMARVDSAFMFNAVAASETTFCVVGPGSKFATSTNGTTWTISDFLPGGIAGDVIWDGSYFIVQSSGSCYRSADGITWTAITMAGDGAMVSYNVRSAASGAITVVCNEDDVSGDVWLWTTTNHGDTWTRGASNVASPQAVAYGNGVFLALESDGVSLISVYSSPDGINFHKTAEIPFDPATPGQLNASFSNGVFCVMIGWSGTVADARYFLSEDGATWTNYTDFNFGAGDRYFSLIPTPTGFLYSADDISGTTTVVRPITALDTVAAGIYDFAQSPL